MLNLTALGRLWRLLLANFLINTVTGSFMLFLPWVALSEGGDWRLLAAAAPLLAAPMGYMLGAVEAGRVGDHHHPRNVLAAAAAMIAAVCLGALAAMAMGLSGGALISLLLACTVVVAAAAPFIDGAIVKTVAASDDQVAAMSWRSAATQSGTFGGPALALLAYAAWGLGGALALLATLALVAGALTWISDYSGCKPGAGAPKPQRSLARRMIARSFILRRLRIIAFTWNLCAIAGFTLIPVLLVDYAHVKASSGGIITLAGIAAALSCPFIIAALRHRIGLIALVSAAIAIEAVLVVAFGFVPNAAVGFAAYFMLMMLNSTAASTQHAVRTIHCPPHAQASVGVSLGTTARAGGLVGALMVMMGLQLAGAVHIAAAFAVAGVALALYCYRSRIAMRATAQLGSGSLEGVAGSS